MADNNFRPSPLPTKLGPTKDANDGQLLTLLELLDLELTESFISGNLTSLDYAEIINGSFGDFQTWCWEIYVSMIDNKDKTYYFFKDALIRYQSLKNKIFFEKENQIYHIRVAQHISKEGDRIQQIAKINYDNINKAINVLEDYLRKEPKPLNVKREPKPKIHGFNVKNQECIKDAYNQLLKLEIIAKDASYFDFEKAFLGQTPTKKIIWLRGPGLLKYLIKSINGKGIRDEKKSIWETTINCFQDKNKSKFESMQLRHGKVPKNIDDIKIVIDTFNEYSMEEI